ncbi:hypothetical protein FRAHR75_900008 [Frankia sp. Hr75.2]|nr:hypothetical protein FRAHR75_900008 [Frankia sp. Hr75.2]
MCGPAGDVPRPVTPAAPTEPTCAPEQTAREIRGRTSTEAAALLIVIAFMRMLVFQIESAASKRGKP